MLMSWFIFLGAPSACARTTTSLRRPLYVLPAAEARAAHDLRSHHPGLRYRHDLVRRPAGATDLNSTLPSLGISGAFDYFPVVAGGVLACIFALERIVLRLAGDPIDDALDEAAPAEVAVELENAKA